MVASGINAVTLNGICDFVGIIRRQEAELVFLAHSRTITENSVGNCKRRAVKNKIARADREQDGASEDDDHTQADYRPRCADVLPVRPSLRCSGETGFPNTSIGFSAVSFAATLDAYSQNPAKQISTNRNIGFSKLSKQNAHVKLWLTTPFVSAHSERRIMQHDHKQDKKKHSHRDDTHKRCRNRVVGAEEHHVLACARSERLSARHVERLLLAKTEELRDAAHVAQIDDLQQLVLHLHQRVVLHFDHELAIGVRYLHLAGFLVLVSENDSVKRKNDCRAGCRPLQLNCPAATETRAQFRILRSRQGSEGAQTEKRVLLLSSIRAAMRTRRKSIGPPAKQKSCDLDDSFDADQGAGDKENVDANIQSRTRGRRGLTVATKRKKTQTAQGNEATDRASKRRKRAVATPEKPARAKETQGTPHSSKCPGTSQETPPAFTFTKGKQTFRKRNQLKEKQKSQQCDQKRIEDLVQYFKGLDDQKLKFAEAQ